MSNAAAATAPGWYFKPNSEHRQPEVYGGEAFIDKYGCVYLGSSEEKVIYLTFDAGYENGNVEKTLDVLKRQEVPGTFFILPNLVKSNTALVKRMHEEGHLVGNHSYSHKNMSNMPFEAFEKEITDLEALYAEYTGYTMSKLFRPPEGAFTEQTLQNCARLGLTPVFWSFAYADWDNNKQPDPQAAKEKILSNVHNGMVMLLHPTSATNAAILEDVIVTLKNEGYRFGRVDELCVPQTTAAELDYYKEKGMVFSENPNGGKVVALTFDDGPHPEQTPKVLDVLEKYGAKGTFFVIGKNIAGNEAVVRRILDDGHEIGNHTYTHPLRSGSSDALLEEAAKTTELLESTFDYSPVLFRPPGGNISGSMIESICASGYKCVLWSWRMDTRDWASPPVESVVQTVLRDVKFGDIILFHDNVYGTSPTAEALEIILPELIERGYSFVTVSELLAG